MEKCMYINYKSPNSNGFLYQDIRINKYNVLYFSKKGWGLNISYRNYGRDTLYDKGLYYNNTAGFNLDNIIFIF